MSTYESSSGYSQSPNASVPSARWFNASVVTNGHASAAYATRTCALPVRPSLDATTVSGPAGARPRATAGPLTVTGTIALIVVSSVIRTTTLAVPLVTPVTLPTPSTVATALFDED